MELTLLGSAASPYTARVRLMIYARALPVAIAEPPGGLRSAALRARNPLGKVPVLELRAPGEAPRYLPESGAILDYLEEAFAERPLRPADAWGRARDRALMRCAELQLDRAVLPLFRALLAAAPAPPLDEMREALRMLDALLRHFANGATAGAAQAAAQANAAASAQAEASAASAQADAAVRADAADVEADADAAASAASAASADAGADAAARADAADVEAGADAEAGRARQADSKARAAAPQALSLADCALLPSLFYALRLAEACGEPHALRGLDVLRARWQWLEAQPAAARVLGELDTGFRALRQQSAS